jgi:hypothetical protein
MKNEFMLFVDALPGLVWTALPEGHAAHVTEGGN